MTSRFLPSALAVVALGAIACSSAPTESSTSDADGQALIGSAHDSLVKHSRYFLRENDTEEGDRMRFLGFAANDTFKEEVCGYSVKDKAFSICRTTATGKWSIDGYWVSGYTLKVGSRKFDVSFPISGYFSQPVLTDGDAKYLTEQAPTIDLKMPPVDRKQHSEYGITSFGGPDDYQDVFCKDPQGYDLPNTQDMQSGPNEWYVASAQRYPCNTILKVTAGSKCLYVRVIDIGPAAWVEDTDHAKVPILDASPAVGKFLFNQGDLGWTELRTGKYRVHVEESTDPNVTLASLGTCAK